MANEEAPEEIVACLNQHFWEQLKRRDRIHLASADCILDAVETVGGAFLLILNRGDAAPPALIDYVLRQPSGDPRYLVRLLIDRPERERVMDRVIKALEDGAR